MAVRAVRIVPAFAVLFAFTFVPSPVAAQQTAQPPRIGVLWPVSEEPEKPTLEAFRHGLRELGYREGQDILIEYRYSNGDDDLLPELAAELVRLEVDLILTWGVTAARAAKEATAAIPIVNGAMSDPVGTGLVQSLAHPGGNWSAPLGPDR
jgi:putative tryptophan/tyrosine transport system substrate-binding protein